MVSSFTDPDQVNGFHPPINQPLAVKPMGRLSGRLREFDLAGKVFIVSGGARGLGLAMAEALVEAGASVHCTDWLPQADSEFELAQSRAFGLHEGSLHYHVLDVRDTEKVNSTIASIASTHGRLDGLVAAAGIQQTTAAIEYTASDVRKMLDVNYTGVFMTATACAREMIKHGSARGGAMVLVGSISGLVANKGLISPVYNSSKAAVIQLGRNLAMEWGGHGIRVNTLCPGHVLTPMVQHHFDSEPELKEFWERENMLGRLGRPHEFRGPVLFLLSQASAFMTGATLVVDGGHSAW